MSLWQRVFGRSRADQLWDALQLSQAEHLSDLRTDNERYAGLLDRIVGAKFDPPVMASAEQTPQTDIVSAFNRGMIGGDTEDFLQEAERVANA